jgi:hypothetical protein
VTGDPVAYAFVVQGHLDAHWAAWLGNVTVTHLDDGTSRLVGPIADQAELHGLLAKLRDLGITLIAVAPATPRAAETQPPNTSPTKE